MVLACLCVSCACYDDDDDESSIIICLASNTHSFTQILDISASFFLCWVPFGVGSFLVSFWGQFGVPEVICERGALPDPHDLHHLMFFMLFGVPF